MSDATHRSFWRHFLVFFIPFGLLLVVLFLLLITNTRKSTLRSIADKQVKTLVNSKFFVFDRISQLVRDTEYLTAGFADNNSLTDEELRRFLNSHTDYYQLRALDSKGHETVKLINADSIITLNPGHPSLQYKGDSEYFEEAQSIESGQFYISSLNLNRENGKIEKPFKPVIRSVTMLTNADSSSTRWFVANYNASVLLSEIQQRYDDDFGSLQLLNHEGAWLVHQDTALLFASDFPEEPLKRSSLHDSERISTILNNEEGYIWDSEGLYSYVVISFQNGFPAYSASLNPNKLVFADPYWVALFYTPKPLIVKELGKKVVPLWLGFAFTIVLLSIASVIYSRQRRREEDVQRKVQEANKVLEYEVAIRTKELKEQQEIMQMFVKHAPGAIAMFDNSLHYLAASDQWYKGYGIEGKEIIGRHHYDIFPEIRNMPEWMDIHQQCLKGEIVKMERDPFPREDGHIDWLRYEIIPWYKADNTIGGIIMFTQVITDWVKAEEAIKESEKRFKQLLESVPDGIVITTKDSKIQYVNEQVEKLYGFSKEELIGGHASMLIPERFRSIRLNKDRQHYFGQPVSRDNLMNMELYGLRKDESEFPVELSFNPIEIDCEQLIATSVRDISERQVIKELEQRNRELSQIVYAASHDLQEPLRTVSSFMGLIQKDYVDSADEKAQQYFGLVERSTARMKNLVKDLLDYSLLGKSREVTKVNLEEVCAKVIEILTTAIEEKEVKVHVGELPVVDGNESELIQLFQNLMSNAIKFSRPDRKSEINVQAKNNEGAWLIQVSDNGIGIEEKHRARIFQIFKRLHSKSEYPGTGIGLAKCQKIVELHGGTITVEGNSSGGSTFSFTIKKQ